MKRLLLSIPLLLLTSFLSADTFSIQSLKGGMNSFNDANNIGNNQVVISQNFFTDEEGLATERNGYERRDSTQLGNPSAVIGLWEFVDVNGAEWIISFSSQTFYKNEFGGTPTVFGLNASATTEPDCASNLGRFWCVNGTDNLWWFDGTSTGSVAGAPVGRIVESWRSRIVIADIASNRSTVHFSADGDGEVWTVGSNPTDPFILSFGGANDGFPIIGVWGAYLDNMIVFRKRDIWLVQGFDQADITVRNINKEIGCIQVDTIQELDNTILFLSDRGVEEMRGLQITNISEPIRNLTDIIIKNTIDERSNTQTTNGDWNAGTFDTNVYVDTDTALGAIQFLYPDFFDEYRDGTSGTTPVWLDYDPFSSGGSVGVTSGKLEITQPGGSFNRMYARTVDTMAPFAHGTTYHIVVDDLPTDPGLLSDFKLILSTIATTSLNPTLIFQLHFTSTTSAKIYLESSQQGSTQDCFNCNQYSGDMDLPMTLDLFISTSNYQVRMNDTVIVSSVHTQGDAPLYTYLDYQRGASGVGILKLDNFGVSPQTTTFTSQVISIGSNITSWGVFNVTDSGSALTYQFNSTSSVSINDFNEADWTDILNGQIPSNSTDTNAAVRTLIKTSTWTAVPRLNDFTIRWNEGDSPRAQAWIHDRRYWLAATTSTASGNFNDIVLVYQRNKTWTLFRGINAASYATWRDDLYFGDAETNGRVFKFDVGNADDASDIESLIEFKSYDLGTFNQDKDFKNLFVGYLTNSGFSGSYEIKYEIEQDATDVSMGSANMNEGRGQFSAKFPFLNTAVNQGREIQYKLSKSGQGDRLRLYDFLTEFTLKEAR